MTRISFSKTVQGVIILLIIASLTVTCKTESERDKTVRLIIEKENELKNNIKKQDDKKAAFLLVKDYMDFAEMFPTDSLTPTFLFSAGKVSMNINDHNLALRNFENLITEHPTYKLSSDALFLEAYIFENFLSDTTKARVIYTRFLRENPKHDFADDAEASLQNLGKTTEELIREFEKANQNTKASKQ
jgi:outer membrane protein assembly factor BamD (BamD/ComL family)